MLEGLQAFFTQDASLWSLFFGSLIAATLIPVSSEVMLFAVLKMHPEMFWPALAVATAGNTLGGMVTYATGRLIPHRREIKYERQLRHYGAPALLFAWAPLVGDGLCITSGWLRLNWAHCLGWMALGKLARYLAVAGLA